MSNILEFKRRTPINEDELVAFEEFDMGATALLMDVRTQLNCIQNSLPALDDSLKEIRLDRLINTMKDIFEKVILPFETPASVAVRYERNDENAQSIMVTVIDLERANIAMDDSTKSSVIPNMRIEVAYQELEIGNDFERTFTRGAFSSMLNSESNRIPRRTLSAIFDAIEKIAIINDGATRMTADGQTFIAYVPFSSKYTIVILLQLDWS